MATPIPVILSPGFYIDPKDTQGKKVLLRVDFNVSIKDGQVADSFRISRIIPTIKTLTDAGARVILLAHIDDKEGGTLEPAARFLVATFPRLFFVKDIMSEEASRAVNGMKNGDVILFENLRKWEGEKKNDLQFVQYLATFGDIYMNDAFSVSHRPHASIVGLPTVLPSYFGYEFKKEVEHLSQAFDPHRPFLVVIGGAKFDTKVPLVSKFLDIADLVLVGGAIANDFIKAKGNFVGDSLVSEKEPDGIQDIIHHNKLITPLDVYTVYRGERKNKHINEVGVGERIVDIGERTIKMLKVAVEESEFVLWNGPLGKIEEGSVGSTEAFAKILAGSKAISIIGGGDVVSVDDKLGVMDKFHFISTGGGAMLDFLADETLVGIEVLISAKKKQGFGTSFVAKVESSIEETPRIAKSFFSKIKNIFSR